jgi:hypothetical protein
MVLAGTGAAPEVLNELRLTAMQAHTICPKFNGEVFKYT